MNEELPLPLGASVDGRYRLDAVIGQGAFGVVYRAVQLDIERPVAMKVLRSGMDDAAAGSVEREVEIVRRLSHPHIVSIYGTGRCAGRPYIVWELLEGVSVEDELARRGKLSLPEVQRLGVQLLSALVAAHAAGVIHRDIKPANLFLCRYGPNADFLKVLDFGIGKVVTGPARSTTHAPVGTPRYMSPEQVDGKALDARSDLYAVGLVLAELLTARPVFADSNAIAVCVEQLSDRPVPLSEEVLASPFGDLIRMATTKDPAARPPNAERMMQALMAVSVQSPPSPAAPRTPVLPAGPQSPLPSSSRASSRRARVAVLLAAALGLASVIGVALWLMFSSHDPAEDRATIASPSELDGLRFDGMDADALLDRIVSAGYGVVGSPRVMHFEQCAVARFRLRRDGAKVGELDLAYGPELGEAESLATFIGTTAINGVERRDGGSFVRLWIAGLTPKEQEAEFERVFGDGED